MWTLTPQPIKPEYSDLVLSLVERKEFDQIKREYFERFEKGKHITWQQWLILISIENELVKGSRNIKISVSSGHGIGKSVVLAWLILWMLFCFKDSQIPTTAPTAEQMHDILWKELAAWHKKMPLPIQNLYEWSAGYMRIKESPETWFARAKTARKENPEALAGVHSDHVMVIADEASGVPDEIFNTAEGAMTGPFVIVILISNPTRLIGYFYDTHHGDSKSWNTLTFSSEDSPIVDPLYISRIIEKHGEESDEYQIRVTGQFPKADTVDDQGYVPLLLEEDLKYTSDIPFIGSDLLLGVDPAGEGKDETVWIGRDRFKAKILAREKVSNPKSIAEKTLTIMTQFGILPGNVYIDNFGVGANVSQELAISGYRVNGINVGMKPYDDRFTNLRSEAYWKTKEWIRSGGELVRGEEWKELLFLRYKNTLAGKLQLMPKLEMKKKLGKSPDYADALMLTFIRPATSYINRELRKVRTQKIKQVRRLTMA